MDQIIGAVVFLLIILAQIIKGIREAAPPKQPNGHKQNNKESLAVTRPKQNKQPVKQSKTARQRLANQPPFSDKRSVWNNAETNPPRQKALVKRLAPQGEGERFEADPGTLDAGRILSPSIDPTVKPELESITGIYEQGIAFTDSAAPALTLNIADYLTKPEGIFHAVILAEVLDRPAWQDAPRQQL